MFFNLLFGQRYLDEVWSRIELAVVWRLLVQFFELFVSLLGQQLLVVLLLVFLDKILAGVKNSVLI